MFDSQCGCKRSQVPRHADHGHGALQVLLAYGTVLLNWLHGHDATFVLPDGLLLAFVDITADGLAVKVPPQEVHSLLRDVMPTLLEASSMHFL